MGRYSHPTQIRREWHRIEGPGQSHSHEIDGHAHCASCGKINPDHAESYLGPCCHEKGQPIADLTDRIANTTIPLP